MNKAQHMQYLTTLSLGIIKKHNLRITFKHYLLAAEMISNTDYT